MAVIIDRTSRILLFLRTKLGEESEPCSVNELTKSSRAWSIRGSVPYILRKRTWQFPFLAVNLLLAARRYLTLRARKQQVHVRIDMRSVKSGVLIKDLPRRNVVLKSLISRMTQRVVRETLSTLVKYTMITRKHSEYERQWRFHSR